MIRLSVEDVEEIVRLLGDASDPTVNFPLSQRKWMLVEDVAELVGADVWIWLNSLFNRHIPGDVIATSCIDGGWRAGEERARFMHAVSDPRLRPAQAALPGVYQPELNRQFTIGREFYFSILGKQLHGEIWDPTGLPHMLLSFCAVDYLTTSCVGFFRRHSKPEFTERERIIVHVIFEQVDWLHRHGQNVPAGKKVLQLSRREREVLVFLLGGDSLKLIACKMRLSEHTVGDYVKQIYKRLGVSSRAELLAHFIAGGQPRQPIPL